MFLYGILNGHAGDLPRYRSNACQNWAIINAEEKIGLSIHFMESGRLDSGDIVIKEFADIGKDTTIGEIYKQMEILFPKMFLRTVEKIEQMGKAAGIPQSKDREHVLRCFPRIPSDSYVEWNAECNEIDRLIRAFGYPFQGVCTFLNGKEKIYIQKADIAKYEFPSVAVPELMDYLYDLLEEYGVSATVNITNDETLYYKMMQYKNYGASLIKKKMIMVSRIIWEFMMRWDII